ncbi:MAG TPA: response regulator [Pirellulales bacterium]|nr:response regulator [Pirellulales bacterium]
MSESTYFLQECPTCGRSLHIRVEYLGREVVCQHCRGRLLAHDGEGTGPAPADSSFEMLQRVDELLDLAEQRRWPPR